MVQTPLCETEGLNAVSGGLCSLAEGKEGTHLGIVFESPGNQPPLLGDATQRCLNGLHIEGRGRSQNEADGDADVARVALEMVKRSNDSVEVSRHDMVLR